MAAEGQTRALLLADHPALELLNSTFSPSGETHELIGDGRSFLAWLVDTGAATEADARRLERRFGARDLDEAAREARALRTFAAAWIERWRARPGDAYEAELRKLNALLERASDVRRLERDGKRFVVEWKRRDESPGELVAMLAGHVASLIADEDPSLVKKCASSACTLWFLDRTKAHRRKFCSVAVCGNREKVAAFRARRRKLGA